MSDRLTEALADRLGLTPYQQGTVAAAVLALIQSEEARQAIRIALTYVPVDPDDLYEGCLGTDQADDGAQRVQAALDHFLRGENPDG